MTWDDALAAPAAPRRWHRIRFAVARGIWRLVARYIWAPTPLQGGGVVQRRREARHRECLDCGHISLHERRDQLCFFCSGRRFKGEPQPVRTA